MKKTSIFLLKLVLFFSVIAFTRLDTNTCKGLHHGTFIYFFNNKKVKVVIDKDTHTEYHENGKYVIQSRLEWINDCEYTITCLEITLPNPSYNVGDQMHIVVNRVYKNEFYFTATLRTNNWSGSLLKIR